MNSVTKIESSARVVTTAAVSTIRPSRATVHNNPASARSLVSANAFRTAANASTNSRGEPLRSKRISSDAPSHTTAASTPSTVSVHSRQSDG